MTGPFSRTDMKITVNPSWEAVKALPSIVDGYQIVKEEIPVVYSYVSDNIPRLLQEIKPNFVLHVLAPHTGWMRQFWPNKAREGSVEHRVQHTRHRRMPAWR
jgi:Pyroglutamyl peptidase